MCRFEAKIARYCRYRQGKVWQPRDSLSLAGAQTDETGVCHDSNSTLLLRLNLRKRMEFVLLTVGLEKL